MNKLFTKILFSTCLLYTICSFVINFVPWLFSENNSNRMLAIWANLIILLMCFIVCIIYGVKNKKKLKASKHNFIYVFGAIYTLSSYLLNIIQYIIKKDNFWNGYTLLILMFFSLTCACLILKIKFKNYLVSSILNFFVIGFFYYIFFVVKTNYKNGNALLISLGIYFVLFISIDVIYYLMITQKRKRINSEKTYKNLFS